MSEEPYRVGYRRPPRHSQFRKGQSGNPKGRPKARKNLNNETLEILGEQIKVNESGRPRALSKQTIIIKRMVADAIQGDAKARDQLLRLIIRIESTETGPQLNSASSAEDAEIMARFKARLMEEIKTQGGSK